MTKRKKAKRPKRPPGRPSAYSVKIGDLICALLAEGKSLRTICKLEKMPHLSTVLLWVVKGERGDELFESFSEQYARAREAQAETLADEVIDIADDATQDELFTDEGKRVCNAEFVARSRVRIDARKWFAAKVLPKKYGEKTTLEHQGKDGKELPAPQNTVIYIPANGRDTPEAT